jgi:hypothetical protein
MATKKQSMKAKKDTRKKTKAKVRVKSSQSSVFGQRSAGGFHDKRVSIYDLINDVKSGATHIKSKLAKGEIPEVGIDRLDFLKGIQETMGQVIKMHGGIAVYMLLAENESRFQITPENAERIEGYERSVVRFVENVDAVVLLDQAKKLPEDYIELVIDMADVLRDLMVIQHIPTYEMLKRKEQEINRYITEHLPTGMDVFEYTRGLHEERIKQVGPLYVTTEGVSAKEIADMVLMTQDLMNENGEDVVVSVDTSNIKPDEHPDVEPVKDIPQDPITEQRIKDAQ